MVEISQIITCKTGPSTKVGLYFYSNNLIGFIFISLTNKEASTVLCPVVKHTGSDRARKKCRGTEARDAVASFSLLLECSIAS